MTIDQLRYAVLVSKTGSITEAARQLFISQPSLSASLHALETEIGIRIFHRTNRGVTVTGEGEKFLGYARQVIDEMDLIAEQYLGGNEVWHRFCVSTQHYSFAVKAFSELIRRFGGSSYEFRIRETRTYEIIEDVAQLRSSVGILFWNPFNRSALHRVLLDHDLVFHPLFTASPHVFVGRYSPLAEKQSLKMEDLDPYPRLSYEQGEHNSFFFSEEIQSTRHCSRDICVSDRATLFNLLIGLDGYTICSGVLNTDLNGSDIVSRPLEVDDCMHIGYITPRESVPGYFTACYIDLLKQYASPDEGQDSR